MNSVEEIIKEKEFLAKANHLLLHFPTARKVMEDMIELAEKFHIFDNTQFAASGGFTTKEKNI